MSSQNVAPGASLSPVLEPKWVLLGFSIIHLLGAFVVDGGETHHIFRETKIWHSLPLLTAGLALWLAKPWSYLIAIGVSGYQLHKWLGGLFSAASIFEQGGPWRLRSLARILESDFEYHPEDYLRLTLITLIFSYSLICLGRHLTRRQGSVTSARVDKVVVWFLPATIVLGAFPLYGVRKMEHASYQTRDAHTGLNVKAVCKYDGMVGYDTYVIVQEAAGSEISRNRISGGSDLLSDCLGYGRDHHVITSIELDPDRKKLFVKYASNKTAPVEVPLLLEGLDLPGKP